MKSGCGEFPQPRESAHCLPLCFFEDGVVQAARAGLPYVTRFLIGCASRISSLRPATPFFLMI
jgi:hypothetical protein